MPVKSICAFRGDGLGQVEDPHAGNLGDEDLAAAHPLDAAEHEADALVERQPEPRHAAVGHGDPAAGPLRAEDRNDASPAAQHVAVAGATEPGSAGGRIGVALHQQFFGAEFRGAVEVDRVDGLVGAQAEHLLDAAIDRRVDDVPRPVDVGLHRFAGIVLAGRDLLQGGGVDHDIDAAHRPPHAVDVADVAEEVAEAGMIEAAGEHLVLLQLVAAEDDDLAGMVVAEEDFDALLAEGTGSAGNQDRTLLPKLSVHGTHLDLHGIRCACRAVGARTPFPWVAQGPFENTLHHRSMTAGDGKHFRAGRRPQPTVGLVRS